MPYSIFFLKVLVCYFCTSTLRAFRFEHMSERVYLNVEPASLEVNNTLESTDKSKNFLYVDLDSRKAFETNSILTPRPEGKVRFVAISDTHTVENQLSIPPGDVLIHAGDVTWKNEDAAGKVGELGPLNAWMSNQPCARRILIGGNHDKCLDKMNNTAVREVLSSCNYLQDEGIEIQDLKIYGSPISLPYAKGKVSPNDAFTRSSELDERVNGDVEIDERITRIPEGIDVLVTHGPPFAHLDDPPAEWNLGNVGSPHLAERVGVVHPKVHIFGHVHGRERIEQRVEFSSDGIVYINAASVKNFAKPFGEVFKPIVFDMPSKAL